MGENWGGSHTESCFKWYLGADLRLSSTKIKAWAKCSCAKWFINIGEVF